VRFDLIAILYGRSQFMYRAILCVATALSVFSVATLSADAAGHGPFCGPRVKGSKAPAAQSQVIEPSSKDAVSYSTRGATYSSKGDYDRAIADFSQAISLDPKDAAAYSSRAAAYTSKGDYDRAIADYDQAIRLNPKYVVAYDGRGTAWNSKGDYDRAIADYNQALIIDPNDTTARDGRERARAARDGTSGASQASQQ
jgi:tetratricopeptide (TPR) repeat protein